MPRPRPWQPIKDLPDDYSSLTNGELEPLLQVWQDQREELEQTGLVQTYNEKLRRRWAIETGIIEGVYSLDRGITETLIERGIDASLIPHDGSGKDPVLIAQIIEDPASVLDGFFAFIKGDRLLTVSYIKELHAALLRHQDTTT